MLAGSLQFDQYEGVLLRNTPDGDSFRLDIEVKSDAFWPKAGQFLQVKINPNALDPLLHRPLSVSDFDAKAGILTLRIRPVGRGTRHLVTRNPGSRIGFFGPLGEGFPLEQAGSSPWIIAGGIGAAPMVFLARALAERGIRVRTLVGAARAADLVAVEALKRFSQDVVIWTEDASAGSQGVVTAGLAQIDEMQDERPSVLYACGPVGMLKTLEATVLDTIPVFASLEAHMACGVGACLGCAVGVRTPGGAPNYARVCREGPVFPLREVVLS